MDSILRKIAVSICILALLGTPAAYLLPSQKEETVLLVIPLAALLLSALSFPQRYHAMAALFALSLMASAILLSIGDWNARFPGILSFAYLASAALAAASEHALGGQDG